MRGKRVMVGVLALLMGFGWSGRSASATEGGPHETGEALIPETLQGIWHEVMEGQEHLEEIIAAGQLADVHKEAFHIRDLVETLPKVSGELSTDTQQRLQEGIDRIADIAGLLDQYGDAGDAVNTKAQADRLAKLLQYIETLYPESALPDAHTEGQGQTSTHHEGM